MCTQQREIVNRYTGKTLYVKCGKCPACLQEKALHRVARIKATETPDTEVWMLTLTYSNDCVPYVFRQDAYDYTHGKRKYLYIYRDSKYRRVRVDYSYDFEYRKVEEVGECPPYKLDCLDFVRQSDFHGCKDLRKKKGCIGVCYYPDLQQFLQRLRINLKRVYKFYEEFKTFNCSEYGTKSLRPHFHLLLFIPKGTGEVFRSAIIKSWPYGDISNYPKRFERTFRASSYVASYVNSGSDFPAFLKDYFKPKHSYSKGFALGSPMFQLPKILELYHRGSLSYTMLKNENVGVPRVTNVLMPSYVIRRYFPKFKGYSGFAPVALPYIIHGLLKGDTDEVRQRLIDSQNMGFRPVHFTFDDDLYGVYNVLNGLAKSCKRSDFKMSSVRLQNAYQRFLECCPEEYKDYSMLDYAILHTKVWSLHASTLIKLWMEDSSIPLVEKYDNIESAVSLHESFHRPLPVGIYRYSIQETDPNRFPSVVRRTRMFEQGFHDNIKHRKVTNAVLMQLQVEM